jgi:hypothetical protein
MRLISRRNIMTAHVNPLTAAMNGRAYGPQRSAAVREQSFAVGVSWPIERASLQALFDLGLTVLQIAKYFSTDPAEVQTLLNRH